MPCHALSALPGQHGLIPPHTHNSKHSVSSQSVMGMGEALAAKLPHFQDTRRSASVPAKARAAVRIASFQLHQGLTCSGSGAGVLAQAELWLRRFEAAWGRP